MKGFQQPRSFALALAVFLLASPSAFAKDSKTIDFTHTTSLGGVALTPGHYEISWVSHSPEATVTVKSGRKVLGTTEARWVERNHAYESNAVVEDARSDGSKWVMELRFAGKTKVLVFEEPHSSATQAAPMNPSTAAATAGLNAAARPAHQIRFVGKPRAVNRPVPDDNILLLQEVFPEPTNTFRRQMK